MWSETFDFVETYYGCSTFATSNTHNRMNAAQKSAILTIVSNRKKHDKGSIGYMIGMMSSHSFASIYWNTMTREKLIEEFASLLDTPNADRLLQSPQFEQVKSII